MAKIEALEEFERDAAAYAQAQGGRTATAAPAPAEGAAQVARPDRAAIREQARQEIAQGADMLIRRLDLLPLGNVGERTALCYRIADLIMSQVDPNWPE